MSFDDGSSHKEFISDERNLFDVEDVHVFFHVVCISLFFRLCLMTDSGFSWESLFIVLDQLSFLDR